MTQGKEITADEIYKRIFDQFEAQKKNSSIIFEFENFSFSDKYTFQEQEYLDLFSLLLHIFEIIKVRNYSDEIQLKFENCFIKTFKTNNLKREPLDIGLLFKKCKFNGNCYQIDFLKTVFNEKISFKGSNFKSGANFKGVIFNDIVYFDETTFDDFTDFDETIFDKGANFDGSIFNNFANFEEATFNSFANFKEAIFDEGANFKGAIFDEGANFEEATFNKRVYFQGVTFKEAAYFKEVIFDEGANFKGAIFDKIAYFKGAIFNDFTLFTNSIFNDFTLFEEAIFVFVPKFHNAQLHTDTDFKNCHFKDISSERAWRAYRTLKQFMMRNESDHEAQMFHALELESRYNTELSLFSSNGFEKIASFFLKYLTNYGRNLWRPLLWLVFFGEFFLIIYIS